MSFDEELRRALRRKDPPPGFAERVLRRISEAPLRVDASPPTPALLRSWPVRWLAAAVAASLVVALGASSYYAHRQAVAEAERVKQEVKVALRIASEKLNEVQQRVAEFSRREF